MPARSKKMFLALLAAAGLAGGLWLGRLPDGLELRIVTIPRQEPLVIAPLEPGELFTLHYVHSVDKEPIWEVHSADSVGRIFVEEERFIMVGAGMGDLPGRGRWTGSDGVQAIKDMHYPVGEFVLRIGSLGVDHTILWRGTETNLSAVAAGKAALVSVRPVSRIHRAWRRIVPHPAMPK